jgi:hypothetical protein
MFGADPVRVAVSAESRMLDVAGCLMQEVFEVSHLDALIYEEAVDCLHDGVVRRMNKGPSRGSDAVERARRE